MKRRSKADGKVGKAGRRKAATPKRSISPKAVPSHGSSSRSHDTEIARLARERDEALEQQAATSEVLRVLATSPGDLDSVFRIALENAVRICDASFGVLYRYEDALFTAIALLGAPKALEEHFRQRGAFKADAGTSLDHVARTKGVVRKADAFAEPAPGAPVTFGGARDPHPVGHQYAGNDRP